MLSPPTKFLVCWLPKTQAPHQMEGGKGNWYHEDLLHRYTNVYAMYEPDLDFLIEIFHSKVVGIKEIEGKLV